LKFEEIEAFIRARRASGAIFLAAPPHGKYRWDVCRLRTRTALAQRKHYEDLHRPDRWAIGGQYRAA